MKLKQMYEHLKENGDLMRGGRDEGEGPPVGKGVLDIKAIQQKRQHAEITRLEIVHVQNFGYQA